MKIHETVIVVVLIVSFTSCSINEQINYTRYEIAKLKCE